MESQSASETPKASDVLREWLQWRVDALANSFLWAPVTTESISRASSECWQLVHELYAAGGVVADEHGQGIADVRDIEVVVNVAGNAMRIAIVRQRDPWQIRQSFANALAVLSASPQPPQETDND